jgi:hypothetical protein
MAKIDGIDFALAAAELLPYIAPNIRQSIDESRWDEIRLDVAHHVERWMDALLRALNPPVRTIMHRTPTSILLGAEAPRVLTIPVIAAVLADRRKLRARNTVSRWVHDQVSSGALRPVTRGLDLNQLAAPRSTAAEAAGFIRTGAIVSLQTVLGEPGITNNFSDVGVWGAMEQKTGLRDRSDGRL